MNSEEFEMLCEQLRAQYLPLIKATKPELDEDEARDLADAAIVNELWKMFQDEKISKEELTKMAGQLGYEPSEDFGEAAKVGDGDEGGVTVSNDEGKELDISKEQLEKAQGYSDDKDSSTSKEDKENDEEEERKEARKLFDLDN